MRSFHTVTSERGRQTPGWGGCQTIKTQTRAPGSILSAKRPNEPPLMEVQTHSSGMCESTQRSSEPRRKRMDERSAPSEMARIITDPATGKCYCRGKVLGKVARAYNMQSVFFVGGDLRSMLTVCFLFPGRVRQMLRVDRPRHQQSLRSQNHPACTRLQASPTREGKQARTAPRACAVACARALLRLNRRLSQICLLVTIVTMFDLFSARLTERLNCTEHCTTSTLCTSITILKTRRTSTSCWNTAVGK